MKKPRFSLKFKVVASNNQVEAQIEPLAPIMIMITQDMKNFQSTNDMLTENALACQLAIGRFLRRGQWVQLGFLCLYLTVGMHLGDSKIACVC